MARVLWKGAITFGLVNIPVGLYSAEKRNELSFSMLDRRDMSPVGYKRFNKESGKEVPWDQIVKGYEYESGRYVVLSDADFRAANVHATQTVDILHFADVGQIPFTLYETPYYLAPDKRGERGYALLRETLLKTTKVALAQVVIRTRQYLAVLAPLGRTLILNTLRYPDELRSTDELDIPEPRAIGSKSGELDMAMRLVEQMTKEFEPKRYHDTYREDVMARVKAKVKAGETEVITEPEKEPARKAEVIDLMSLLKRSVEQGGKPERASSTRKASHANGQKAPRTRIRAAAAEKRPAAARRKRA